MAGPPGIEIGSDCYAPLRHAFVRRKSSKAKAPAKARRNRIPNYTVKADGHGYWQSAGSRALGFKSVDCGFDREEARSKGRALNEAASAARKARSIGQNTNREAA